MDTNRGTSRESRAWRPSRRSMLKYTGTGLLAGTALSGVASADGSDTAGRPMLRASAPSCGTLRLEYVRGNPPLTVFVDGPKTRRVSIEPENRERLLDIESGEYEVTAKPGDGGSSGTPAVVVEGSPVTVEACVARSDSVGLGVTQECLPSGEALARYTLSNPGNKEATVEVTLTSGSMTFDLQYTIVPNTSRTVPATDGFTADGSWTHTFSATHDGEEMPVNGGSTWANTPDCS